MSGGREGKVLVAGVGNIFLSDDAFGVEVVGRLLRGAPVPGHVDVLDVGTGGIHLAHQLLDGYETLILVDALPHGGAPGSLCVLEPDDDELEALAQNMGGGMLDAHALEPVSMLATVSALGARPRRTLVVGCQPASVEDGIGLSAEVAAALDDAVIMVADLWGSSEPRPVHGRRDPV